MLTAMPRFAASAAISALVPPSVLIARKVPPSGAVRAARDRSAGGPVVVERIRYRADPPQAQDWAASPR
nr:hypothetical protein KPHV_33860 [Kitasatospora purpeofusca]